MFNAKACGIAAGVGFVLSFIIGLCSDVRFGFVVLRAVIFAVLCGGLCFAAMFVFNKFLRNPVSSEDIESAQDDGAATGSIVDITVGEDSLPDDASEPSFSVSASESSVQQPVSSEASGFTATPVDKMTKSSDSVSKTAVNDPSDDLEAVIDEEPAVVEAKPEKVAPAIIGNAEINKKTNKASETTLSEDLDQLPDFGDMASGFSGGNSEKEGSSESSSAPSVSISGTGSSGSSVQDADVVAQAIRTMLNGD